MRLKVILLLLLLGSVLLYFYFPFEAWEKKKQIPDITLENLTPKKLQGYSKINLEKRVLKKLGNLSIVREFNDSPFKRAFNNRIFPLLTIYLNQIQASQPYPSKHVTKYFFDSTIYILEPRNFSSYLVTKLFESTSRKKINQARKSFNSWLINPAQNQKNWSIDHTTVKGTKLWRLTYKVPDVPNTLKISFGLFGRFFLMSPSMDSLKNIIRRSTNNRQKFPTPNSVQQEHFINFRYSSEGLTRKKKKKNKTTSKEQLSGTISVKENYINITTSFEYEMPNKFMRKSSIDTSLLNYHPPSNSFILQWKIKDQSENFSKLKKLISTRYKKFSQILREVSFEGMTLSIDPNNARSQADNPLIVLSKPSLQPRSQNNLSSLGQYLKTVNKSKNIHLSLHNNKLLMSLNRDSVESARKRYSQGSGFVDSSPDPVQKLISEPHQIFLYSSSSIDTDSLKLKNHLPGDRNKMINLLFGFDPIKEAGGILNKLPGTAITIKNYPQKNRYQFKALTAGDVLLPDSIRTINLKQFTGARYEKSEILKRLRRLFYRFEAIIKSRIR